MPNVNREALPLTHAVEPEPLHAEVPVARATSRAPGSQVEPFNPSTSASVVQQQGSYVGAIAASAVGQLDARAVVGQVKELMGGWRVSDDDCKHAVGLLQSLPPAAYASAMKELSKSGELKVLCEAIPSELRRELAQSAVRGGLTRLQPERSAWALSDPQPPTQPALIANPPSLPSELREVIHVDNKVRARQYEADFAAYATAYCAKAATCKTALELRQLGRVSSPADLIEPEISSADLVAKRFVSLHNQREIGVRRATRAVSDQVSVFRRELTAGGFGLDFKLKGQVTFEDELPSKTKGEVGHAMNLGGTFTQDGRVVDKHVEDEGVIAVGRGHNKLEGKFGPKGHLEGVAAEIAGAGLELDRESATFKGPIAPALAVETSVNSKEATVSAALVAEQEAELFGMNFKLEGKVGFTAKGSAREYDADIGGKQEGIFGPMPELEDGTKWSALPKERREWYGRQGFDEASWPR